MKAGQDDAHMGGEGQDDERERTEFRGDLSFEVSWPRANHFNSPQKTVNSVPPAGVMEELFAVIWVKQLTERTPPGSHHILIIFSLPFL